MESPGGLKSVASVQRTPRGAWVARFLSVPLNVSRSALNVERSALLRIALQNGVPFDATSPKSCVPVVDPQSNHTVAPRFTFAPGSTTASATTKVAIMPLERVVRCVATPIPTAEPIQPARM